jgi:hypothetical protein
MKVLECNVPKPASTVLNEVRHLTIRLNEQAVELTALRAALEVQFTRIAHMQAELDVLPTARERRKTVRSLLRPPVPSNGNGREHS